MASISEEMQTRTSSGKANEPAIIARWRLGSCFIWHKRDRSESAVL